MKKALLILLVLSSLKVLSQNKKTFIYTNGKVRIELTVGNTENVLKKDKRNAITILAKNCDFRTLVCVGPGLRLLKGTSEDDPIISLWEINLADVKEKMTVYTFHFAYKKNKKSFRGKFEIPVE